MRIRLSKTVVPLWAIFFAVCFLIYRSYLVGNPHLTCEAIRQQDIEEVCSAYSSTKDPESPAVAKPRFPFHPFDENHPKLVVILTYQRCGSTFFGEFFNENTDAFYMFEPLDSLYSAMYGTKQGWNVPSDITNYQNGSLRVLPPEEIQMVSQFLQNLLACNAEALPTETLVHRFFTQFSVEFLSTNKYVQCVMRLLVRAHKCQLLAPDIYCGNRFGNRSEETMSDCRQAMTDENYRQSHPNSTMFDKYFECMRDLRALLDKHCSPIWQSICSSRSLRAVKLVRATMDSMEPLLRTIPNLRVIQLVRDPRAVVLSRHGFDASVRGMYSGLDPNRSMAREAHLYCQTVVKDVHRRRELQKIYPGKLIHIIYDDVVKNVKGYIRDVYEFLGMPMPEDVWCWQRKSRYPKHYGGRLNSTTIANKWQEVISMRQNKEIVAACEEFFKEVKYSWANRGH